MKNWIRSKTLSDENSKLDNINTGIITVDCSGYITECNKVVREILNLRCKRIIGCNIRSIIEKLNLEKEELEKLNVDNDTEFPFKNNKIKNINIGYRGECLLINKVPLIYNEQVIGAIIIIEDKTNYKKIVHELSIAKHAGEILNTVLEIVYDGIIVVDKDGYVTMMSKAYTEFLEVDRKSVIGKHVTNVIENTRMHNVARTGIPETAQLQKLKGRYIIATRIPIIKNGKVEGAVGKVLFRNLNDFNKLYNRISKIEKENQRYNKQVKESNSAIYCFDNIIGNSSKLEQAKNVAKKAALTNSNVLLKGESGTGKELFAHSIHKASDRAYGNFVKVNCAAIPTDLLESELFGYDKGSFTGAKKEGKIGKFELADGGTIFLDEIGDMPLHMQAKLLRVLQEKEVERVGSVITKKVDIRVIAATNRNLEEMVKEGQFREDLYYRLNVVTINIPSLRERPEDIEILTTFLVDKISKKLNKKVNAISNEALEYMKSYEWKGNVRQLENVIERAMNVVEYGEEIKTKHLPNNIVGRKVKKNIEPLDIVINKTEKEAIVNALIEYKGNKTKVAKALNISRTTLYEKMNKHSILG